MTLDVKPSITEAQGSLLYAIMVQIKCLIRPTLVSLERKQEKKGEDIVKVVLFRERERTFWLHLQTCELTEP